MTLVPSFAAPQKPAARSDTSSTTTSAQFFGLATQLASVSTISLPQSSGSETQSMTASSFPPKSRKPKGLSVSALVETIPSTISNGTSSHDSPSKWTTDQASPASGSGSVSWTGSVIPPSTSKSHSAEKSAAHSGGAGHSSSSTTSAMISAPASAAPAGTVIDAPSSAATVTGCCSCASPTRS